MARDGETFSARPDPAFNPGNPPEHAPMTQEECRVEAFKDAKAALEDFTTTRHVGHLMARVKTCEHAARLELVLEEIDVLLSSWRQRGLSANEIDLAKNLSINLIKAQVAIWEGEL